MRVWRTSERLQGEGRSWRVRDIAGVGYLLSSVFCIFPKQKYYWALEEYGFLRRFAMFLLLRRRPSRAVVPQFRLRMAVHSPAGPNRIPRMTPTRDEAW